MACDVDDAWTNPMTGRDLDEARRLVNFWRAAGSAAWFAADAGFDDELRREFGALHDRAIGGTLDGWANTADGSLALVLLLDQLSRNLHRDGIAAYAGDARARTIAGMAVDRGFDRLITVDLRPFLYLPFQHAEDMAAQDKSVRLAEALAQETGDDEVVCWARHHRDIVARFGRFPHRNDVLGRRSTREELAYLAAGGFGGAGDRR